MNVLIVSPWFRSLAHLYGRVLRDVGGHRVLVVASDRHFEAGYGFCDELTVSLASPLTTLPRLRQVRTEVRRFRPDVAVTEPFHHPAWLGVLPHRIPQVLTLHEPDSGRDRPDLDRKRKAVAAVQRRSVASVVCFSRYAASLATSSGLLRVDVVPLVSEMPDEWVPPTAADQVGFVVAGRATRNKGLDIAVDAWSRLPEAVRHAEPLTLLVSEGDGYSPTEVDGWRRLGVRVRSGRFAFREAASVVAEARCMLLPYRNATQSGAQAWALQLGVTPLVSDVGALREYQPPDSPPVESPDPDCWVARMQAEIEVTQPQERRAAVRHHYQELAGDDVVARAWERVLRPAVPAR